REEFGKGNDFCQKITYKVSGKAPEELISEFRNSYYPRIAVTVDMIATGTDIKPLEALIFMRPVKSRVLYEQMLGRGTRVIQPNDLMLVSSDARRKDRFVIVDAVGVTENPKFDTQTLERKRTVPLDKLLQSVALNAYDADTLSSLANRLARLAGRLNEREQYDIAALSGGMDLREMSRQLLDALDPDRQAAAAQAQFGTSEPTRAQVEQAAAGLMAEAVQVLADTPALRRRILDAQRRDELIIDESTRDVVREAGFNVEATERARATVESFRQFIEQNKDEIDALQLLYSRPYAQRQLTRQDIQALAEVLSRPPYNWTTEALWRAYAQVEKDKVRGVNSQRLLTDLISLVRHAVQLEDELAPYPELVQRRYQQWLADQAAAGRAFTPEQRWWLDRIAQQIGVNLEVTPEDFDYGEFFERGGRLAAMRALGREWLNILEEINRTLSV
ncbi:MAG TPA: type I restriction-modification enzyme R subunit C-terminal domain-containing protein, partial [Caldilineaceae bacterium]|nr:type I restriction-modification enzyme R subunit C-terminal domain-containing protein [Caldilineaceae bacterium]